MLMVAPEALGDDCSGLTVNAQPGGGGGGGAGAGACWLIVTVFPAIVAVPVLAVVPAAIVSTTVPLPVPVAPDFTVMNPSLLVALHTQLVSFVTAIETSPPDEPVVTSVGETAKLQTCGIPEACTMSIGRSATRIDPRRPVPVLA